MAVVRNRALRILLLVLGWFWVGVAFVGVILPIIPTTGPVLLAAFLFSMSSERFDSWLVNNRYFGGIVSDWRAGVGFTVRAKIIAVTAIILSFGFTTIVALADSPPLVLIAMWTLALAIATFVVTRPTKRPTTSKPMDAVRP
ncbi:MAG: YbaN family protein [Acidimicrobiia bacterium]|nr:MAG: YbaN family protein [Acidimicrobiia bacterium]